MKYKIIITILTLLVPIVWCIFLGPVYVPFLDEDDELEITPEKETEENEPTK